MANCLNCQRARGKREEHLFEQGLIECKPCSDATVVLNAFWLFAENRVCGTPFLVKGSATHKEAAWPFQFHPEAIEECAGYLPKIMRPADEAG